MHTRAIDRPAGDRAGRPPAAYRLHAGDGAFFAVVALSVALWFYAFPIAPVFRWLDVCFDALVLLTAAVGLLYVRAFGYRTLELAWKILILSHLVCLLDCFTVEPKKASTVIVIAIYVSETIMILAILWGFQRYHQRRVAQERRLKRARQKRRQSERRYAELVHSVEGIVWEANPETWQFLFVSNQAERILGYPVSRWYEEQGFWVNRLHPEDRDWAVNFCLDEVCHRRPHVFEYRMVAADGKVVWLRDLVNSVQNADGSWRLCGVMFVITETKELEERLRHIASHDALTRLPNRDKLLERLREVHCRNIADPRYALLFLDVDRFKIVNDTMGHHHGDSLLVELARRLAAVVGEDGMVARLGGDEFAVLIERVRDAIHARTVAARLQKVVSEPVEIGGRRLEPSVSVGIVIGRKDCNDVQDLLQDADTAMYQAKGAQRGSAEVFDMEMRRKLLSHVRLEADLKRGFRSGEFQVFFQPIVDLRTGTPNGFEALTRWLHPERGIVPAGEFMGAAIESEMGAELAWNAVRLTFEQARKWESMAGGRLRMFCNLSEKQFVQNDFLSRLEAMLVASGADPRNLVLEITEDVVSEELVTEQKLCELKRVGFELALDDFGVGRSSLNRLCRLPIDLIKVDRTFIRNLEQRESEILIRAIKAVGEDLGMEVLAEGIETENQRSWLSRIGFRLGQGYLFDRALPSHEAEAKLRSALKREKVDRSARRSSQMLQPPSEPRHAPLPAP